MIPVVRRVLVLGPGAAGKSTLARRLGEITGLPVIELDKVYWGQDLIPLDRQEWVRRQRDLTAGSEWILDGDLGPYDVLETRLDGADTVIVLALPLPVCAWRALRRSHERWDFWSWLLRWRRESLPRLRAALAGRPVDVRFLRSRGQVQAFIDGLEGAAEA